MIAIPLATNPFPGLRPYDSSQSDLFFGRDEQIDELLGGLRARRFVAVIGASGSGKSSLVRAGLVPALERGYLAGAGSEWRIATLRPGGDPIGELARNVGSSLCISETDAHTELSRSSLGLVELARRYLRHGENLLVLVDQFEELFRYHKEAVRRDEREASSAFVKLLLTAVGQSEVPIPDLKDPPVFVVLTMRSDYLGKSSQFRGLPEALNHSQYLVPRMTREQLQEAIEGPVGMAGARIRPGLVQRMLNDTGDDPNQLPVLQHALMRTWEVSSQARSRGEPIDLPHFEDESVGGMGRALNLDADQAFVALGSDKRKEEIARRIFQRLVEPGAEDEESRLPTRLNKLSAVCEASESEVREVIKPFRERGFLVLSGDADPIVDISHESLIRLWDRLRKWVKEESDSASIYTRLADWVYAGFPFYSGLVLDQALHWRSNEKPNNAWARRYRPDDAIFRRADDFLERSRQAREDTVRLEQERRESELRRARLVAVMVFVAFLIAAAFGAYAYFQKREAVRQRAAAEKLTKVAQDQKSKAETQRKEFQILSDKNAELAETEKKQRIIAEEQKKLADSARTQSDGVRIAITALNNRQSQPDLASLLSLEARRIADTFEARNALLTVLQSNPGLITMLHHPKEVSRVVFSPDGLVVATASEQDIWLWDASSYRFRGRLTGHTGLIRSIVFSPTDSRLLVSAGNDNKIRFWDVANQQVSGDALIGEKKAICSLAFSPDGKTLASGSDNGTIRLWDVSTRQAKVPPWDAHPSDPRVPVEVIGLAFGPDNKLLASAGDNGTGKLWRLEGTRPVGISLGEQLASFQSLALSGDGKIAAMGGGGLYADRRHRVRVCSLTPPLPECTEVYTDADVWSVAFNRDGNTLAASTSSGTIHLWNVRSGRIVPDSGSLLKGHTDRVRSLAFSNNGLLASAGRDGAVRLWRLERSPLLRASLPSSRDSVAALLKSLVFSPDGQILAAAYHQGPIWLASLHAKTLDGESLWTAHQSDEWPICLAFSPDGKTLASISSQNNLQLWDVLRRKAASEPFKVDAAASRMDVPDNVTPSQACLGFANRGKMLVLASYHGPVWPFDLARRELRSPINILSDDGVLALSPDGRAFAAGAGGSLHLWDIARQSPIGVLRASESNISNTAFSSDGKRIATRTRGAIEIWDVRTQRLVSKFGDLGSERGQVAFSPDGKTLVADSRGAIRLLDLVSQQVYTEPLGGHGSGVTILAFSPDGHVVASGNHDGSVLMWTADREEWAAKACALANRNLSMPEWQRYISPNIPYHRTCDLAASR
jgi:WD40 repeat protein